MTAREKFHEGQRVKFSREGMQNFPVAALKRREGIITGFSKNRAAVYVEWPDIAIPESYHIDFLEAA